MIDGDESPPQAGVCEGLETVDIETVLILIPRLDCVTLPELTAVLCSC